MRYANGIHKETKQSREIDLQTEAESVIAEYDLFCPGCGAEAHFRHGAREEQADQRHDATEKTRKESNKKNHGYSDEHAPDCIIAKGTRIVRVYSDEYVDIDGMVAYRDKDRQGPTEGGQEPPCEPGEGKEPEKVIPDDGDERFDPHAERRITKAATATEKGEKTFTCETCHLTRTEEIAALGGGDAGVPTGDNAPIAVFALLALLSAGGVLVLIKKKAGQQ